MKRMLFNATHPEELRVAIVDGQKMLDLDIESTAHHQKKGNIYKGQVTRVEPSLEAAFVEYGSQRQGFLSLKEISRAYFTDYSPKTPMAQVRIQDVIKEGQELLVQVEKDERGNKGAALTTFISLAGRFLVFMPNNPKGGGISRRIEGDQRAELREAMSQLTIPTEHALIARTAGIGKSPEELQWDLDFLLQLWEAIRKAADDRPAPFLVYQETNLVVRAIRDYLRSDIAEIMIDDRQIYDRASKFMEQVMPHNLPKLKLYQDTVPLFSRFQIEHQIEAAFSREVRLPSGGAVIIDHTEALVTIDVNSARATKGADIEETAQETNLEAADEIARQLRIRDLGGLIVIDFIDMTATRNQRTVENRLQDALKSDRARVQVGRISRFGLLEMSRQRLRASLGESNYVPCPRCMGTGYIRGTASSALHILRILEEEALKENTEVIHAHLPTQTATYLLNEKRHEVNMIENRLGTQIVIVPTTELGSSDFRIKRLRGEDLATVTPLSYEIEMEEEDDETPRQRYGAAPESAMVGLENMTLPTPPSPPRPEPAEGFLKRLFARLLGSEEAKPEEPQPPRRPTAAQDARRTNGGDRRPQGKPRQRPQRGRRPAARAGGKTEQQKEPQRSGTAPASGGKAADEQSATGRPRRSRGRGRRGGGSSGQGTRNRAPQKEGAPQPQEGRTAADAPSEQAGKTGSSAEPKTPASVQREADVKPAKPSTAPTETPTPAPAAAPAPAADPGGGEKTAVGHTPD